MAVVAFTDQAAWHDLRSRHIGASEVSALFNLSPWTTRWKLYMSKTGQLPAVDEKDWMTVGRHFEPAIASYSREVFELDITKVDHYWTDDQCRGLGASLDYTLANDIGAPVEIKWVQQYDGWDWTGEELTVIPDYYMLQVQHQMACTAAPYGMLIAFIGGTVKRMTIPRSEGIITAIRQNVTNFWADVAAKIEPPVDFLQDADSIFDIARHRPLRSTELPAEAAILFAGYLEWNEKQKQADNEATAAKAALMKMVLDTPGAVGNDGQAVVTCGDYRMKLSKVADNPGKLVTAEMIGTTIGQRKGYIRTTITGKKE